MLTRLKRRGVVLIIFVVLVIGGGITGELVYERILHLEKNAITAKSDNILAAARRSLLTYMLLRSERPFNIARPGGRAIMPRMLMLPCPDNLGDHDLNGTQDPACGADGASSNDMTNGVLDSGSRFGRLPYSSNVLPGGDGEVSDGLGLQFRDGYGNNLWYALSKNVAPFDHGAPLNFHRLGAVSDNWLTVINLMPGEDDNDIRVTVNNQVVAVVLAPGKSDSGRLSESFLSTASLAHGDIDVEQYFNSYDGESNADANGIFIRAFGDEYDNFIHINFSELAMSDGRFMNSYTGLVGITQTHNAPAAGSPLGEIRAAIGAWKDFFGYYPPPAANITTHINSRNRHCAEFHTAVNGRGQTDAPLSLLLPSAVDISVSVAATVAVAATVNLQITAGFLSAQAATLISVAQLSVILGDMPTVVAGQITIARYARITLTAGASIIVAPAHLSTVVGEYVLPAGITVSLVADSEVLFAADTPLALTAFQQGWLPEHHRTAAIIDRDNSRLSLSAPLVAGFLGTAVLTSAINTLTLSAQSRLLLQTGIRIDEDFHSVKLHYDDIVLYSDGIVQTLITASENYKPRARTFLKRDFVALLLQDIVIRGTTTVHAPKIIYPWRKKTSPTAPTASRDNMHDYPTCFDSRYWQTNAKTFMEDNNVYYAVAPNCHYGASENCGNNGITITLDEGVQLMLANAYTLTHSYTATINTRDNAPYNREIIAIENGKSGRDLTIAHAFTLPIGDHPRTHINMPKGFVFNNDVTIIAPANAAIKAGGNTRIENAHAVLIYSPGPMYNTQCTNGIPLSQQYVTRATLTLARQGENDADEHPADLTQFCQWLDDDENADGDLLFNMRESSHDAPASNDFFMFFGGQLKVN